MTSPVIPLPTRREHRILYDFHNAAKSAFPIIELDGHKYKVTKNPGDQYAAHRITPRFVDYFRSFVGLSGETSQFIAKTLNNTALRQEFHHRQGNQRQIEGICFSGGGAKGYAYNGVLKELGDARLKDVKQVSGASAGALTATLVAFGLSTKEIDHAFRNQSTALDQKELVCNTKKNIVSALSRYQHFLPQVFDGMPDNVQLENITLGQLEKLRSLCPAGTIKQLFISVSLADEKKEMKLSYKSTPHMPVWKAAVASAALPLIFDPVEVSARELNLPGVPEDARIKLRDGGIHNNLPHRYLKTTNNLILSFDENEGIYNRSLSAIEHLKQWLAGEPVYEYRQADHDIADRFGVHYIRAGVTTTQTDKARKNLSGITRRAARDLDYYLKYDWTMRTALVINKEVDKAGYKIQKKELNTALKEKKYGPRPKAS